MSNKSILFLLDASGSMGNVRGVTVGGFNAWKRTLELIENDVRVTLTTFDDYAPRVRYDHVPARKIPDMEMHEYVPNNQTALYDALKIEAARVEAKHMRQGDTALVIILTDGEDNRSKTSSYEIQEIIRDYRKKGWSFLYLSSDYNYLDWAARMGIEPNHCVFFQASKDGTEDAYKEMTRASMAFAHGEEQSLADWAPAFEEQMKVEQQRG